MKLSLMELCPFFPGLRVRARRDNETVEEYNQNTRCVDFTTVLMGGSGAGVGNSLDEKAAV